MRLRQFYVVAVGLAAQLTLVLALEIFAYLSLAPFIVRLGRRRWFFDGRHGLGLRRPAKESTKPLHAFGSLRLRRADG